MVAGVASLLVPKTHCCTLDRQVRGSLSLCRHDDPNGTLELRYLFSRTTWWSGDAFLDQIIPLFIRVFLYLFAETVVPSPVATMTQMLSSWSDHKCTTSIYSRLLDLEGDVTTCFKRPKYSTICFYLEFSACTSLHYYLNSGGSPSFFLFTPLTTTSHHHFSISLLQIIQTQHHGPR